MYGQICGAERQPGECCWQVPLVAVEVKVLDPEFQWCLYCGEVKEARPRWEGTAASFNVGKAGLVMRIMDNAVNGFNSLQTCALSHFLWFLFFFRTCLSLLRTIWIVLQREIWLWYLNFLNSSNSWILLLLFKIGYILTHPPQILKSFHQ